MLIVPPRVNPLIPDGGQLAELVNNPMPAPKIPNVFPEVVIPLIVVLSQLVIEIPLPPLFVDVIFVRTQLSDPAREIPVPPLLFTVTLVSARLLAPHDAMIPNVPASNTVMFVI